MTSTTLRVLTLTAAVALLAPSMASAAGGPEFPLGASKIQMEGGAKPGKRRVNFQARWSGDSSGMPNPAFAGATLRVVGGADEGDSGLIRLANGNWRAIPGGKGYVYSDKTQSAGGIKTVVLRLGKKGGGRLKIAGGKNGWSYEVTREQTAVTVTLMIGEARFCAVFSPVKTKRSKVQGAAKDAPATCPCDTFDSTFAAIQAAVFERNGCTEAACHGGGSAPQGGLDLSPDVAYDNLVNVLSPHGQKRVQPGSPKDSFLYRKLAAATLGDEATVLSVGIAGDEGGPMPSLRPAISKDELEAIRRWIQYGAKKDSITPDTEQLLNSCLPPTTPPKIDPPAKPEPGKGIQFYAPPWTIRPKNQIEGYNGEDEICYSTYYDLRPLVVSGEIPADVLEPCDESFWGPGKTCFSYKRQELTQDPNSHHSIIHIYNGQYPPTDPGWRNTCFGGPLDGQACDPTVPGVCGDGGNCHGKPVSSVACIFNFGPDDYQGSATGAGSPVAPTFSGSQQPYFEREYPGGVFAQLPIEGTIVWNSHAFNVSDQPITNEQWLNLFFARQAERQYPIQPIFDADDIFVQNVPPFEEREYCRTIVFGKGTRIADLSSHTHKRALIFQTWGPSVAASCSAADQSCDPETSAPIFKTLEYNDPAQLRFDPPLALDGDDPASRRFKFCALYDNGKTDPATVKRNSLSPPNLIGGKCYGPTFGSPGEFTDEGVSCLAGPKKGKPCQGVDANCDSAPGAGDGLCDACPLRGGVTTEDEMFILIGSYFCDETVAGEGCSGGICAGGARHYEACNGDGAQCPGESGACVQQAVNKRCAVGARRGQLCATDADCTYACVPSAN